MMDRTHDALRGAAALAATLAFVVGLPLGLALVVGNPLPSSVPTWDALRLGLERNPVQAELVVNVLAVLLWAVWARGTLALASEAIAAWQGRAMEPPPSSMGPRALAARAVASITLLSALLPGRVAEAAPLSSTVQRAPAVAIPVGATPAAEGPSASAAPAPAPPAPTSGAVATYSVAPRDTWWSIAEAALDDGLRWREVRDLNVGRTMVDGHVVNATDEQLVEGWSVLIPGGAQPVAATAAAHSASSEVLVAPGDTLWHIAEHELGDPFEWPSVFEANAGVAQPDGDVLRDPDLIQPGWRLTIPAEETPAAAASAPTTPSEAALSPQGPAPRADGALAPAPPETAPPPRDEGTAPSTATTSAPRRERPLRAQRSPAPPAPPAPDQVQPSEEAATAASTDRPAPAQGGLGGLAAAAAKVAMIGLPALAASGLVVRLGLLRRLQLRRRHPDRSLPRPESELEPLERQLRAIAAEEVAEWVELGMRLLTLRISEAGYEVVPRVLVVQAGEFGFEVLLDQPCPAPEGFEADPAARVWRLHGKVEIEDLRQLVAGAPVISPALVSLGVAPEGPVLVDLETLGVLSVEGDEHRVRAFLAGAALQLATASWSEIQLAVLDGDLGVTTLERGPACADVEELVARVATNVRATANALGELGSTTAARVAEPDADTWAPVVAVVGPDRREEVVPQLAQVVGRPGQGGALIAAGPVRDAPWRLSISATGEAVLSPLGLEVDISGVDYETVTGASRLLEVAAEEGDHAPLVDLAVESARHHTAADVGADAEEQDVGLGQQRLLEPPGPGDVVVRVLGRPEVTGWHSRPPSRKCSEIVEYLAVHDAPVPTERLREVLWPVREEEDKRSGSRKRVKRSPQSLKSAVHRTRVALGFDDEGQPHLPPAKDGCYRLGAKVRCDWTDFRALVECSRRQPREQEVALLRSALEWVRGAPFSYVPKGTRGWACSDLDP
jgi:nucleoid-associated protein YgaU